MFDAAAAIEAKEDPPPPPSPALSSLLYHPLLNDSEFNAFADFLDRVGNDETSLFDPKLPPLASVPQGHGIDRPLSMTQLQWGSDRNFDFNGYSAVPPPPSSGIPSPETLEGEAQSARKLASRSPREASESSSNNTPSPHTGKRERMRRTNSRKHNLSDQQKRENHIQSEQKRRQLIRDGFSDLDQLVPALQTRGMSKSQVLTETADFIVELQEEIRELRDSLL